MNLAWVAQGAHPVSGTDESETHTIFWCGFTSMYLWGMTSRYAGSPSASSVRVTPSERYAGLRVPVYSTQLEE